MMDPSLIAAQTPDLSFVRDDESAEEPIDRADIERLQRHEVVKFINDSLEGYEADGLSQSARGK